MYLYEQHCQTDTAPQLLDEEKINQYLKEIPQWNISVDKANKKVICRTFKFKDYHQTLLFINSIAAIIHKENHHPDITFGYNNCTVLFSTHSAGGITIFDLICASHIDQLLLKQDFNV